MKIIKVKHCSECPHHRHDNGGGFCEPFVRCEKFSIILDEQYKGKWVNLNKKIHPLCKLEDQ